MEVQPLFADIGDVIGLIITLAIIGFSVVSKMLSTANQGKQPPQQQRPAAPPQPPKSQRGGGIESEIEEFLRQARGDGAQPRRPKPPPVAQTVVEAQPVMEAEPIVPGQRFGRSLSQHVEQHIGQDSISSRDAHLGDAVEAVDERLEQHLEEVFDHEVGHLAHTEKLDTSIAEGTDDPSWEEAEGANEPSSAQRIFQMLRSPEGVRDVFIASEILKRPEI